MIELRNVAVKAGAFSLSKVTFTIPSQAFGVVVGAAGSGKTTLLEAIAGVRTLSGGSAHIHSHDVTKLPPENRAIGLVYQRGALFPHRTVRENIAWSSANESTIASIVEELRIANLFETPVPALSGGERQLVALARALVRVKECQGRGESPVLLLDEPFSALDPRRRLSTREAVNRMHREWKLTTLQVTHDGFDARRADVVVLLDAGSVVQSGPPDEILRSPAREDVKLFFGE